MASVRRSLRGLTVIAALVIAGLALGACQAPGSVLRGTVTTAAGSHPAGIGVAVYSNVTDTIVSQTTTDTAGDYSFADDELPDGTYRILFATSDWWNDATSWGEATPVALSAAAPTVIDATVGIATGSVAGTVTGDADPLPGVAVAAIDATSGSTVATTATDSDGTYRFSGLPTGSYVFRFTKAGYTTRYNDAAADRATAPVVAVTGGGAVTGVDTTLTTQSTITGTVTDGSDPAPGVLVIAFDPSTGDALGHASTATAGAFTLTGLEARAYTIGFIDGAHHLQPLIYGSASTDPTTGTHVTPVGGTIDLGTIALVASTAPGAPTAASATPGDGQATVTWVAPADDGGAPVTGYTVTASTGQTCATTGATSCVVTGLTNGTATSFTVTATNLAGTGSASAATAKITPMPADYCTQDHTGVSFTNRQFTNADFAGCDFTDSTFSGANLTGANLTGANFTGADLVATTLTNANLTGATLTGVSSGHVIGTPTAVPTSWQLTDGYLIGPGADLRGADLANVDLAGADLTGVDFSSPLLVDWSTAYWPIYYWGPAADLAGANLSGANLTGVNLMGGESFFVSNGLHSYTVAAHIGVDLTDADLTDADLTDATLGGAGPSGAVFTDADLTGTTLTGVISGGITGAPAALPTGWQLTGGYLIGPGANLASADFSGVDLSGVDFTGLDLTGATFTGTDLSGAILTGTTLTGVISGGITGTPAALPTGWQLTGGYLIGPGANLVLSDLSGLDLTGADLTGATLAGVSSGGITGTPAALPTGWQLTGGYLIGPAAHLTDADLTGEDLTGANLQNADLTGADLTGAVLTGANLINSNLAGADLTGATLTNANLNFADLTGATLTGVISGGITGTPAALPTGWTLVGGVLVPPPTP